MRGCGGKTAEMRAIDIRSIYVYEFVTFETETGTVGDRDWLAKVFVGAQAVRAVLQRLSPIHEDVLCRA